MPNRQIIGGQPYRYGYQGEFAATDPETGKPAFEARLYDPRINRWLTTDPNRQFHSPYIGMGNYFTIGIDPDGRDVILLHDASAPFGAAISGHTALLIGNDKDGWTFYNKTGNTDDNGVGEIFKDPKVYNNINEFYEAYGKNSSYQAGIHITTSADVDAKMRQRVEDIMASKQAYELSGANCQDFCRDVMESGGIDLGSVQQLHGITWPNAEFINAFNQTDGDMIFFQDARNKMSPERFAQDNLLFFQHFVKGGFNTLQSRSRFYTNQKRNVTISVGEPQIVGYDDN